MIALLGNPGPVGQFAAALAVNAAVIVALYPVLRWRGRGRALALWGLGLLSAVSPCVISPGLPAVRFAAALVVSGVLVKLYDLGRESFGVRVPSVPAYIAFVENAFWHVYRRRPAEGAGDTAGNLRRVAVNLGAGAVALALAVGVWRVEWARWPFALEHVAKVVACYAVLEPAANGLAAAWRLLGLPAMKFMGHPELARTPADFWRRWNRPTQLFLYEHVFLPAGGRRWPVRATLATFAVSALVHEYVFGIAASRVQGVQTCFFMLQGLAAAATLRLRPTGWGAAVGVLLTLAFNLVTSRLFFLSVGAVVPFYVRR